MQDVTKIFREWRSYRRAYEACLALYGLLTFRKTVTDAKQGPQIFIYDSQFKEYANTLKRFQVADSDIQAGNFRVDQKEGDFDLYVGQEGLGSLGVGPLAWVLLIAGIGATYAGFKLGYEWLRQKGREEEEKYQAWFSTLPADKRQEVAAMDEHARAEAAKPGIFSELRDVGKSALDIGFGIAIAIGAILLFNLFGGTRSREE